MKRIFGPFVTGRAAVGLLIIRIFVGMGLALHGYQKLSSPGGAFNWGNDLPFRPPAFFQGLATLAELGGGLAVMAGLLTPLAAAGILITMGTAIVKFHWARGAHYVALTPGPDYELAGHYFIFALGILLTGPGSFSLDALVLGQRCNEPADVS